MKHTTFRALLSLVLVCVLLISWSPIRAQASVLGGATLLFGDDAIAILLAVLAGLGVCAVAGSETSDLESRAIARSAMDAMEEAGTFVKNGALSVYTSMTEAWSYAVSTDLVQWLHGWLWTDSGVMNNLCTLLTNEQIVSLDGHISDFRNAFGVSAVYGCCVDTGAGFSIALSKVPIINEGTVYKPIDGSFMWLLTAAGTNTFTKKDGGFYQINSWGSPVFTFSGSSTIGLNGGVELKSGVVAPPGTDIQTEYGEYIVIVAPNGVPDTGGDGGDEEQPKIPVLPVPYLPPSEIPNVPQKDIWKGNKVEIDNPDTGDTPDPTTGTDTDEPDSGSNDPTTPTTGTDTDPDTGTDVPPADIADYSVDLTNFFPFCLPFDIYAFFELLAADPEAPHLEFDIPFPFMDEPWHLVIDLSAWDNVALLARRLELLGFIIGLCVFTREKFLRS